MSASGPVTVERNLFAASRGERAICPLELRAGIIGGFWTPLAARHAAYTVAQLTPREAADLFRELGIMSPSSSSLDRLPKILTHQWENRREEWEEALRSQGPLPCEAEIVAVSLDGVMVPMKDCGRKEKRTQEDKQPWLSRGRLRNSLVVR